MIAAEEIYWPKTSHNKWMSEDFVKDLVSVIMPTHNREQWVTQSLDSIVRQTYRPIELIIVNDGSTDNTLRVLEDWQAKNSGQPFFEIKTIFQENTGAPGARNNGLINSKGEFIQHFDDDDLLGPKKIMLQVDWLRKNRDSDMVYGSVYGLGDETKKPYQNNAYIDQRMALLQSIRTHTFNTISPLYTRKAAIRIGPWHEQMACGLDREYTARFLCTDLEYGFLPEAEVFVRGYEDDYERASLCNTQNKKKGYYRSKLVSLDSLSACLPHRYKEDAIFKRAIAKEYLGISIELILLGEGTYGLRGIGSAKRISRGTSYVFFTLLIWLLIKMFGPYHGSKTYNQLQRVMGSLYRRLSGL